MIWNPSVLHRRIAGILILLTALLQGRTAFFGDFAFQRKPSLILAPLYAPDIDPGRLPDIRKTLERELAALGSHKLYPKSLIENFYLERDNAVGVFDGSYRGKAESFELGRGIGVERVATASVLRYSGYLNIYLTIHDIATDQIVSRVTVETTDVDTLIGWTDRSGNPIDLGEATGAAESGIGVSAAFYLFWLALVSAAGVLLVIGLTPPRLFIESTLASGILLALFSWIYALNGDMDYVQRFVATSGLLHIGDTRQERTATAVRYLLPLLLISVLWFADYFRRVKLKPGRESIMEGLAPVLTALSALLCTLALPNFLVLRGLPALAWFATAPLYLALRRAGFLRGIFLSLFFVGLQSLLVNWWQGTFSYVSLPFTVGLMLFQSLPFAVFLAFTVSKLPRAGFWAAPLLWAGWDWVRSLGFLGYPWGLLGVSQYAHPALIQSAAFGGVWLVSFLTHWGGAVTAFTADSLVRQPSLRSALRKPARALRSGIPLLASAAAVLAIAGAGSLVIQTRDARRERLPAGEFRDVRILLNQQNTDPRKHDYELSFNELSRLTEEALSVQGPFDLVVWPESGFVPDIRFWLQDEHKNWKRGKLVRTFLDWQAALGIPLVTGTQDHFFEPGASEEEKKIQNSSVYLAPDRRSDEKRSYYYKIRLVPFTENFPYREEFPWVAELLHNFSTTQWTPGTEHTVLEAPRFRFSTPLCFEDVFPDHLRKFVLAGAEIFVNMSNDYWANTPLEGYQHGAHALFRAVENRRPLVRSTCSGWTISVDTEGRIAPGWPPFYQPGWTVGEHRLPNRPERTFYTRFGDWFPVLCLILWLLIAAAEILFTRHTRHTRRRKPAA